MKLLIPILLISLAFMTSCDQKKDAAYDALYDEVMVIHDEVMPEMGTINKAKKALKKMKTDENAKIIDAQIQSLEDADEAMMSWMHQFKKPKNEDPKANIAYLTEQKVKIQEVKDIMLSTIAEAQEMINKNEAK